MKDIKNSSAKITIPIRKTPITSETSRPRVDNVTNVIRMKTVHAKQTSPLTKKSAIKSHTIEKAPKKSRTLEVSKKTSVIKYHTLLEFKI